MSGFPIHWISETQFHLAQIIWTPQRKFPVRKHLCKPSQMPPPQEIRSQQCRFNEWMLANSPLIRLAIKRKGLAYRRFPMDSWPSFALDLRSQTHWPTRSWVCINELYLLTGDSDKVKGQALSCSPSIGLLFLLLYRLWAVDDIYTLLHIGT